MKKRSRVRGRRVSSLRSSRDSLSRVRDVYENLRERVFTREVTFILLVLFGGMILFDAVGYDYTGMVVSNLGPEAITGAQGAGIPDSAISNIGGTMKSIFKLIFDGFLSPALGIFGDNQTVATKLTLFVIVLVFILPVCKKIFKIEEGAKTVNSASIVAVLISLLGIGLLPEEFVNRLSTAVPIILVIGFLAGVLYGLFKWKTEEKIASFIKGLVSLCALILLTYILGAFDADKGGVTLDGNLSGVIWVIAGFGYLVLAWLFLEGVFIKPFGGEVKTATEAAEEYVERRRDVAEARNVKERGKLEREGMFKERGKTKKEKESERAKRKASKKIKNAEKDVYNFAQKYLKEIGNSGKARGIRVDVSEVISLLRNAEEPQIVAELGTLKQHLESFEQLCEQVYANRTAPNPAQMGQGRNILGQIRVSLNKLYSLVLA